MGQGATWPNYCKIALNVKDFEKNREEITQMHLLLAFFYAMQPGTFSFSISDLLGTLNSDAVNLMEATPNTLYPSLPGQFKNSKSFAMQLQKILRVRRDNQFQSGELIAVPQTLDPGLIILMHRLKSTGQIQLLAVNFSQHETSQHLEMSCFRQTTPIDLMTGLAVKKLFDSSGLDLRLPPLSGKVILLQPKYFQ